jgi:hypothetical protein
LNIASVVTVRVGGGCGGRKEVSAQNRLLTWSVEVKAEARVGAEVEVIKLQKPEQRARWYGVKKRESRRRL